MKKHLKKLFFVLRDCDFLGQLSSFIESYSGDEENWFSRAFSSFYNTDRPHKKSPLSDGGRNRRLLAAVV